MTWEQLLRRQLLLAEQEIIALLTSPGSCPNKFFGSCAPRWDREKCLSKSCSKCWTSEVPPEVLAAHGIDELDRLRAVAEAAKRLRRMHVYDEKTNVHERINDIVHIDVEEALFAAVDALEEAKSGE